MTLFMVLGCLSRKLNGVPHCPNNKKQSLKGAPGEDKPTMVTTHLTQEWQDPYLGS